MMLDKSKEILDVHLVYPCSPAIRAPCSVGWELSNRLRREGHKVSVYDWAKGPIPIPTGSNSILIGHPHPDPHSTFKLGLKQPGWRRRILLQPFNHGDGMQCAHLEPVLKQCDVYLAITGKYWIDSLADSLFGHWSDMIVRVDLAVQLDHFPKVKTSFNPVGKRKFLYIGQSGWPKNTSYLAEIAKACPDIDFGWIGQGRSIPYVQSLGWHDFGLKESLELISRYDFLIHTSASDANPTTILECMAWGLVPVCTPQSGYEGHPGIFNIPLNDVEGTCKMVRRLQMLEEEKLLDIQKMNRDNLVSKYSWDHFYQIVEKEIASSDQRIMKACIPSRQAAIKMLERLSPIYLLRDSRKAQRAQRYKQLLWKMWYYLTQPVAFQQAMRHLSS